MASTAERPGFQIGWFTAGDLIALSGVVFMSGGLWFQVDLLRTEQKAQGVRLSALEQVVPSEYVRRQDYREDVREIKELLRRIDQKVDGKADRAAVAR
jgi:hypothetical protein